MCLLLGHQGCDLVHFLHQQTFLNHTQQGHTNRRSWTPPLKHDCASNIYRKEKVCALPQNGLLQNEGNTRGMEG